VLLLLRTCALVSPPCTGLRGRSLWASVRTKPLTSGNLKTLVRLVLGGLLLGHAFCSAGVSQRFVLYKAAAVPQLGGVPLLDRALRRASTCQSSGPTIVPRSNGRRERRYVERNGHREYSSNDHWKTHCLSSLLVFIDCHRGYLRRTGRVVQLSEIQPYGQRQPQAHWVQRTCRRNKTPALLLEQQRNSCPLSARVRCGSHLRGALWQVRQNGFHEGRGASSSPKMTRTDS
jgi:hypothetical protein